MAAARVRSLAGSPRSRSKRASASPSTGIGKQAGCSRAQLDLLDREQSLHEQTELLIVQIAEQLDQSQRDRVTQVERQLSAVQTGCGAHHRPLPALGRARPTLLDLDEPFGHQPLE